MKKSLLLLAVLFCAALTTYAQDDNTAVKLGVGVSGGGTVGSASGAYPVTGGLILKAEYPLDGSALALTFTTGFNFAVSANGYTVDYSYYDDGSGNYSSGSIASFVPVQIGAKYYVAHRLFLGVDAGVSFNLGNTDGIPTKKIAPLVSPAVGYTIPFGQTRGSLDIGVGYDARIESGDPFSQVALKAVFNFGLSQ